MGKKYWIVSLLLLTIGFAVLLYPVVSAAVNRISGSYVIADHRQRVESLEQEQLDKQLELAREYNRQLPEPKGDYDEILNLGSGIMGYVRIPAIDVDLPIYHGVEDAVLSKGVGHLPGSGFPIGGEGNHAVLTGHTGLPSAKLFTDLMLLEEGDRFYIHVLDQVLCYQVDQIKVVLPSEGQDLVPQSGKDYCTLLTCTPYGVNSHRLLVRGTRIQEETTTPVQLSEQEQTGGRRLLWLMPLGLGGIAGLWYLKRRLDGKRRLTYNE